MKLPTLQPTNEYDLVPIDFVTQTAIVLPDDLMAYAQNISDTTVIEHCHEYFVQGTEFM